MRDTAKKKVLFVVPLPPPIAGPELSSQLLLESSLKNEYHLVSLKLNVHKSNDQKGTISLIAILGVLGLLLRLIYVLITARPFCLYTTLNQNISGFARDSLIALIAKIFRLKLILHFRGSNFTTFYDRQWRPMQRYIRFVLNLADRVILQANWLRENFRQYIPESKISVIYNGIATKKFAYLHERQSTNNKCTNVLFLNHLSVAKGFIDFLVAAKRIVQQRHDLHFFVAGDVINHEKNIVVTENGKGVEFIDIFRAVQSIVRDKRFNQRIHVLGEISNEEEKLKLYGQSDIFVLPSYSEGCPLSALEAMAAGLPVIVTRVGALTEIVTEGENGLFVKTSDPSELERQILRLADEPSLARAMGKRNRSLVQSQFDINLIAREFSNLFGSLT